VTGRTEGVAGKEAPERGADARLLANRDGPAAAHFWHCWH
jgi:hypothetical protein